ncbi:unnamed protein product [Rotaria sordida]|uniref:Uncharacterized protein n=1 Tax=Rotaria sordida TaxID=392033 RepID=A0A818Z5E2_9BILA|nr:unnamed protein product [Rotaria sordida]
MDIDLKQVFSILDENDEGQIQLRRFVDVANNYYSDAEQLARITKALDPNNTGLINFEQFCDGISQISSLQGLTLKEVASDLTRRSRENSLVEDSDRRSLNQDGSTTTFNEYDVESDEPFHHKSNTTNVRTPTLANNTTNTKKITNHNQNSNRNNSSLSPRLDSPFYGDDEEFTGVAEPNPNTYPSDTVYLRTPSQRTGHPLKRSSYLQSVLPTEQAEQQLQETVDELQKKLDTLSEQKQTTTDRLAKIQSENTDLKSRLLALEDRFHDLEGHHTRTAQSEQQRYAEYINQKDRSFLQEKEVLQSRINVIESELKQTQSINGSMKKDVKELKQKLDDVDYQLRDSQIRCNNLADDNEKLLEQIRHQNAELEAEKLNNAQLAEQLSHTPFGRTYTRTGSILKASETRIENLFAELQELKLENETLKRENRELREHPVVAGFHEGRHLLANPDTPSFAAELEVLSKDELMNKVREQYSINDRLREYIERMLTVIIENNPQLLEITTSSGVSIGSMGMSPMNYQQQSSSITTNNKSVTPQNLQSNESIKNDSIKNDSFSKLTTIKEQPADNLGKKAVEKAYDLASKVEGGRDYLTNAANTVNSLVKGKDARVYLKPGNVIQFISRGSGRSLQIVVSKDTNELICDAIGGTGPYFPNANWLVVCGQHSRYYFHNNYNYLGIRNGKIVIIPSSSNEKPPNEAEFRVQDVLGSAQAIYIESVHVPGYFLSFDEDGVAGDGIKTTTKEKFFQFELHLIAYGPGIQPEKNDNTIETSEEASPPPYWSVSASQQQQQSQTGYNASSTSS